MHLRGTGFTASDTQHIVLAMVTVVLMPLAMGFGAAAFGKRFRLYSITCDETGTAIDPQRVDGDHGSPERAPEQNQQGGREERPEHPLVVPGEPDR